MVVKIHGSEAFGYPLHVHLLLNDYLKLSALLVTYAEQQAEKRLITDGYLAHMTVVNSAVLQQTVKKKTLDGYETVKKVVWAIIKVVVRLTTGVPI
jgi:hypothetical protein